MFNFQKKQRKVLKSVLKGVGLGGSEMRRRVRQCSTAIRDEISRYGSFKDGKSNGGVIFFEISSGRCQNSN